MFQSLFSFLIAILTLEGSYPEKSPLPFLYKSGIALAAYLFILSLFLLQKRLFIGKRRTKRYASQLTFLGMAELFVWLLFVQGILNLQAGRSDWESFGIKTVLITLFLIGVSFLQLTIANSFSIKKFIHSLKGYSFLFLIPFSLAYLFFDLLKIALSSILSKGTSDIADIFDLLLTFSFALVALAVMAPITVKIWGCKPIKQSELKLRLEERCRSVGFHHRGLLVWGIMGQTITAALFGFLPRLRYILFTEPLLNQFTHEEVEAVLLHELGHFHYKHLFLYPLICLGAGFCLSVLYAYAEPYLGINGGTNGMGFILFFIVSILFLYLYFRVVFGFFSRMFERAADLFPLKVGYDPRFLVSALKKISHLTDIPLSEPNWHHGSLKQRIQTIERAWLQPTFVKRYEAFSRAWIFCYLVFFFTIAILFLLKLFNSGL